MIEASREILEEIQPATVRAVCYRLFTIGLISGMTKAETNRVGRQLVDARESGAIPWGWIVDETRDVERIPSWDDPAAYAEAVQRAYRRDRWAQQGVRLEVWSEKGTVRGTLAPVLNGYGVAFRVMHGYGSATALHDVAEMSLDLEQDLVVFYVGDHDPSGLHMSEVDLPTRLQRYGGQLKITRLALVAGDVAAGNLPDFDAETKRGDPRHRWYVDRYGSRCWELDALSPVDLRQRVDNAIRARIDIETWKRCELVEAAEHASLVEVLSEWKRACA